MKSLVVFGALLCALANVVFGQSAQPPRSSKRRDSNTPPRVMPPPANLGNGWEFSLDSNGNIIAKKSDGTAIKLAGTAIVTSQANNPAQLTAQVPPRPSTSNFSAAEEGQILFVSSGSSIGFDSGLKWDSQSKRIDWGEGAASRNNQPYWRGRTEDAEGKWEFSLYTRLFHGDKDDIWSIEYN